LRHCCEYDAEAGVWDCNCRVCVDEGIIYGYRRTIFQGAEDAFKFRERVYQTLNITVQPRPQTERVKFPLRALILNRNTRSFVDPTPMELKQILESEEILKYRNGTLPSLYQKYKDLHPDEPIPSIFDVTIEPAIEKLDFKAQVQLWASADLIISQHGAGLTNVIFARTHVPIIEAFPHKFMPTLYRDIAVLSSHGHFGIMGESVMPSVFRGAHDREWCEMWHGADILVSQFLRFFHYYSQFSSLLP
jgi:hypothetical protein